VVSAIASGDRDAMQTLYQRHSVQLHRFVLRLVPDPALSEDIVSESSARCGSKPAALSGSRKFPPGFWP
jgi:DNA-directed RNA polymerase specialized sigma24 family protein